MLKQTLIELNIPQLQVLQEQQRQNEKNRLKLEQEKLTRQEIQYNIINNITKIQPSHYITPPDLNLVKQQIYPSKFTPVFINKVTKQTNTKLYKTNLKQYRLPEVNKRLQIFLQTIEKTPQFKGKGHRQKLWQILRINNIKDYVGVYNKNSLNNISNNESKLSSNPSNYITYVEEGIDIRNVELYQFQHRQQSPLISYQQRQNILKDIQLLFKFLKHLRQNFYFKGKGENSCMLFTLDDLLILKYNKCNQYGCQYLVRVRLSWVFKFLEQQNESVKKQKQKDKKNNNSQYFAIENARRIIRKLLAIPEQKDKRNKTQEHHYQSIQMLTNFDNISNLKYSDFYYCPKKVNQQIQQDDNNKNIEEKLIERQQNIDQLRQMIKKLQQDGKKEINSLLRHSIAGEVPKIKEMTKGQNNKFWNQIQHFILKNINQSQRKSIIQSLAQKKDISVAIKKGDKTLAKSVPPPQKKGTKLQIKDKNKQKDQVKQLEINAQRQLIVQELFLTSASSIKFCSQKLFTLIQSKQSLLYILKIFNKVSKKHSNIAFFTTVKLPKDFTTFFGQYFADPSKKSFIYSENTGKIYPLIDKNHAVGYGPQIFLAIGKIDIIVPCFGTQTIESKQMMKCVSYFPLSYSQKPIQTSNTMSEIQKIEEQDNFDNTNKQEGTQEDSINQIGLQKQFYLEDIDIYEINIKIKSKTIEKIQQNKQTKENIQLKEAKQLKQKKQIDSKKLAQQTKQNKQDNQEEKQKRLQILATFAATQSPILQKKNNTL